MAVEFALVLPLLLLIVFGLIQYGFYFWSMQGGSAAAREAARQASVGKPAGCTEFQTYVRERIGTVGDADSAVVTRSYSDDLGAAKSAADVEVGDLVTVSVEFTSIDLNFPFLPFIDDGRVSQTAQARVDYVPATPESCA